MAEIIDFPPQIDNFWWSGRKDCPTCGSRLRPATRAEIQADLESADPQRRQLASLSTQGQREQVPEELNDPIDPIVSSWQFRCDGCGHRAVVTQSELS